MKTSTVTDTATDTAEKCYMHARDVVQGRYAEGEALIATDAEIAAIYAEEIIQGQWVEAQATILADTQQAFYYAANALKARWKLAEDTIACKFRCNVWYALHFNIRMQAAEQFTLGLQLQDVTELLDLTDNNCESNNTYIDKWVQYDAKYGTNVAAHVALLVYKYNTQKHSEQCVAYNNEH